jgi:hypothetical protein
LVCAISTFVVRVLVNSRIPAHVAIAQWTVVETLSPDFRVTPEVVTDGFGASVVGGVVAGGSVVVDGVVAGGSVVAECGSVLVVVGGITQGTSPMLDG